MTDGRVRRARAAIAFATALVACAHTSGVQVDSIRPVWPKPPAKALVRWVAAFPNPQAPGIPSASFWGRAFDFITGTDPAPQRPLLDRPFGLAVAGSKIYVADPDGRQVLELRWRTGDTQILTCADRTWSMPLGVGVAPDGALWVADGGAGVLVRRDGHGRCRALGEGVLHRPAGVAMGRDQVYVVDPPSHAVWRLAFDGRVLGRLGERGSGEGMFNFPTSVAALPNGGILVVDALNFRIVELSAEGKTVATFGEAGDGEGAFARPKAVAIDESGHIFVSDAQNDVVLMYRRDGRFELAVGGSGRGPGQLTLPAGLAISEGFLFVADSYNHRIGIFELLGGPK